MSRLKVVLNSEGVRALLRSREMMDVCASYANAAAGRLGEGYAVSTYTGKNRVNASIYTETIEAARENLESNTILKALR